ncbi:MAG: hypothetical protein GWN46_01020 [Gammaproteobacteria bacterium]|nr:hypothetical protein [Gammaproteobacteria bacterium]
MTRIILALAAVVLLSLGSGIAVAEEGHEGHGTPTKAPAKGMDHGSTGHMGMEMGKSGMAHGDAMHDMHAHMQALHDHSKMMEGITDQKQLAEEMKKHMRMLDEMMEKMMQRHMESTSGEEPKS